MSIKEREKLFGTILKDWTTWYIGGSDAKTAVYKIVRHHDTWKEESALKVINIVEIKGNKQKMRDVCLKDYQNQQDIFCKQAEDEIRLICELKQEEHIVKQEDFKLIDWVAPNKFGSDLLIRMELLTPLRKLPIKRKQYFFTENEMIHMLIYLLNVRRQCLELLCQSRLMTEYLEVLLREQA